VEIRKNDVIVLEEERNDASVEGRIHDVIVF
jgi:hypothetical protein